jgi:hypothetical protein
MPSSRRMRVPNPSRSRATSISLSPTTGACTGPAALPQSRDCESEGPRAAVLSRPQSRRGTAYAARSLRRTGSASPGRPFRSSDARLTRRSQPPRKQEARAPVAPRRLECGPFPARRGAAPSARTAREDVSVPVARRHALPVGRRTGEALKRDAHVVADTVDVLGEDCGSAVAELEFVDLAAVSQRASRVVAALHVPEHLMHRSRIITEEDCAAQGELLRTLLLFPGQE